jgi:hypothetical protein
MLPFISKHARFLQACKNQIPNMLFFFFSSGLKHFYKTTKTGKVKPGLGSTSLCFPFVKTGF